MYSMKGSLAYLYISKKRRAFEVEAKEAFSKKQPLL